MGDADSLTALAYFVDSEEFAVSMVSVLTLVGLGAPLMLMCYRHLSRGRIEIGCGFGILAIIVVGVGVWKLVSTVRRARVRFSNTDRYNPIDS